mgnify:CR=1 FL=1
MRISLGINRQELQHEWLDSTQSICPLCNTLYPDQYNGYFDNGYEDQCAFYCRKCTFFVLLDMYLPINLPDYLVIMDKSTTDFIWYNIPCLLVETIHIDNKSIEINDYNLIKYINESFHALGVDDGKVEYCPE